VIVLLGIRNWIGEFMKIITSKGIYVQKKDLDLIFNVTDNQKIPNIIIEKYSANANIEDIGFIFFDDKDVIKFLNNFSFIVNFNDFINLNFGEFTDFYFDDLQKLRKMRVDNDQNKFLPEKKVYNNFLDAWLDQMKYFNYVPNKDEIKNYTLEMQLLYNKVIDILEIRAFNGGVSGLEVPEEVLKPVRYSKKQLQRIYHEVLSGELSFEELKPYEKQLYSIFSRIDYTPEILNIIRKIMLISRHNTIDFINDDLLDLILHIEGKNSKFEQSTWSLIDYLYTIGYNKFENFDSRIMLENDIKIIKNTINFLAGAKLDNKGIDKLSQYNYVLTEIIKVLKSCNYSSYNSQLIKEVVSNMAAYIYLNPNAINNDFDFLAYACEYITNHIPEILKFMGYDGKKTDSHNGNFVDNFNRANSLLIYLYNEKNKKDVSNENPKLGDKLLPNCFEQ